MTLGNRLTDSQRQEAKNGYQLSWKGIQERHAPWNERHQDGEQELKQRDEYALG